MSSKENNVILQATQTIIGLHKGNWQIVIIMIICSLKTLSIFSSPTECCLFIMKSFLSVFQLSCVLIVDCKAETKSCRCVCDAVASGRGSLLQLYRVLPHGGPVIFESIGAKLLPPGLLFGYYTHTHAYAHGKTATKDSSTKFSQSAVFSR